MSETLSPPWLAWPQTQALIQAFAKANAPMRFVGGSVRDALLGKPVKDVDAATPLTPEAVMALLQNASIKVIPTGIDHGTVTAVINEKHFEITTLRKDVSTDGRWAEVAYTNDWREDAKRRDFTMNALYLSPQEELFDYFRGAEDAKAGRVRFIGDPEERIREDYLRILRFFRFYAWYGKDEPDRQALAACQKAAAHIAELSGERIRQEMMKLLAAPRSYPIVRLMIETGIMTYALGVEVGSNNVAMLEKLENAFPTVDPITKLMALLGSLNDNLDKRNKVAERLNLSNAYAKPLRRSEYIPPDIPLVDKDRLFRKMGQPTYTSSAIVSALNANSLDFYKTIIEFHPPMNFPVTGDDLIALGYQPDKKMGDILGQLRDQWAASNYTLTKEQLLNIAKES